MSIELEVYCTKLSTYSTHVTSCVYPIHTTDNIEFTYFLNTVKPFSVFDFKSVWNNLFNLNNLVKDVLKYY